MASKKSRTRMTKRAASKPKADRKTSKGKGKRSAIPVTDKSKVFADIIAELEKHMMIVDPARQVFKQLFALSLGQFCDGDILANKAYDAWDPQFGFRTFVLDTIINTKAGSLTGVAQRVLAHPEYDSGRPVAVKVIVDATMDTINDRGIQVGCARALQDLADAENQPITIKTVACGELASFTVKARLTKKR